MAFPKPLPAADFNVLATIDSGGSAKANRVRVES